jgi:Cdc6-like AAA superfamily ATPase
MELRFNRNPNEIVTMDDINLAIKEMSNSKSVIAVKHCSVQQRVFLIACMNIERKSGISDLIFMDVEEEHIILCRLAKLLQPTTSDLHSICAYLTQYHLIISEGPKAGFPHQKIKLNINIQDIITGVCASKHSKLEHLVK